MDKNYYIGQCLICHQGMLEIVKEIDTGEIFIACDECEAEWINPVDAIENINGTRCKFGTVSNVLLTEIQKKKWDKYVI